MVTDWNYEGSVVSKCRVHTLEEYEDLDTVSPLDFYCRFLYDPNTGRFKPDVVPVYCYCETPCNPDREMVLCAHCRDWYHCDCVGFSPGDEGEFYCNLEECQSAKVYNEKNNHSAGALNDVEGQPNWVEDSSTDE